MNSFDKWQMQRAIESEREIRSPEWRAWEIADRAKRDAITIKQGHSLKCGLLRCHPDCPSIKRQS